MRKAQKIWLSVHFFEGFLILEVGNEWKMYESYEAYSLVSNKKFTM